MGTPKSEIVIGGRRLVDWILLDLEKSQSLLPSSVRLSVLINGKIKDSSFEDIFPSVGPVSGVVTALKRSSADFFFFLPVDMPFAGSSLLSRMVQFYLRCENPSIDGFDGVRLRGENFPFLLRRTSSVVRNFSDQILSMKAGEGPSMGKVLSSLNMCELPKLEKDDDLLLNLNYPVDLERAGATLDAWTTEVERRLRPELEFPF